MDILTQKNEKVYCLCVEKEKESVQSQGRLDVQHEQSVEKLDAMDTKKCIRHLMQKKHIGSEESAVAVKRY